MSRRFVGGLIAVTAMLAPASAAPVKERAAVVIEKCAWDDKIGFTRYAELCEASSEFYFAQPEDTADALLPLLTSSDRRERFLGAWRLHPTSAEKLGERLLQIAEGEQEPVVAEVLVAKLVSVTRAPWVDRVVEVVRTKAAGNGPADYVELLDGLATPDNRATVDDVLDRLARDRNHRGHIAALERAPCAAADAFLVRASSDVEIMAAATRVLRDETACAASAKRAVSEVKRRGAMAMRDLAHLGDPLQYACSDGKARPVLRELARWLRGGLTKASKRAKNDVEKGLFSLQLGYLAAGLKACGDR